MHPDALEICDELDNDCDTAVDEGVQETWYGDSDRDHFGDVDAPVLGCEQPPDTTTDATDCDDTDPLVHPDADEICNEIDDDCDTLIDDLDDDVVGAPSWYVDDDADTWGAGDPVVACDGPADWVDRDGDCDDGVTAVNPDATETCDGVDQDCDGVVDQDVDCPCAAAVFDGHTYLFCDEPVSWTDASAACQAVGYDLVTVDSDAENTWVYDQGQALVASYWWIGLNDLAVEGTFEWSSGDAVTYTNWGSGQPDDGRGTEECVHYGWGGAYVWNDDQCEDVKAYTCESPAN
jgi:hypothetical protein